jgi:hypothetical protein
MKKCENCNKKNQIIAFSFDCQREDTCVFSIYDHMLAESYFDFFKQKITKEKLETLSNKYSRHNY